MHLAPVEFDIYAIYVRQMVLRARGWRNTVDIARYKSINLQRKKSKQQNSYLCYLNS